MLLDQIERLRQEPLEVRRHAVLVGTTVIVAAVIVLYIVYLLATNWLFSGSATPDTDLLVAPYQQETAPAE